MQATTVGSQEDEVEATPQEQVIAPTPAALRPRASLPTSVLCVLAVTAAMYVAREVIVPILLALLLSLLLRPVVKRMRKLLVPDVVSAFILVALVVGVFLSGILGLASQAQKWLAEAPVMVDQVKGMLPLESGPLGDWERTTAAVKELTSSSEQPDAVQVEVTSNDTASTILGVSGHFVASALIVFILTFFLLAMGDTLLRQAVKSRASFQGKRNVVELVQNVERGISRYLFTITVINFGLGAATALSLWLMGIPNYILWGVLAGTLNYVPHVGAAACMAVLFFVGAVTHESIAYGALTAGVFAVLTSVESYLITPLVLSKSLRLSPLAVILSILFWGWLWGIPGGLMAAPLLAVVKIVCDQFPEMRTVAALLAGETTDPDTPDTRQLRATVTADEPNTAAA